MSDTYELEAAYREAYWELNTLQLCGVNWREPEYRAVERQLSAITATLGYTPEA